MFNIGGLLGALVAGPMTALRGRHYCMLVGSSGYLLGPVLTALASDVLLLTTGRFVSGIGAGFSAVVVPIYIAEICPPAHKGFFGASTQLSINLGILAVEIVDTLLLPGDHWRLAMASGGFISFFQLLALLVAGQESPKWLAEQGRSSAAVQGLSMIRGSGTDIEEELRNWQMDTKVSLSGSVEDQALLREADDDTTTEPLKADKLVIKSPWQVLSDPRTRPAGVAVIVILSGQALTGINSIIMFGVSVLSKLLSTNTNSLNIAVAALNPLVTILAAPLPDRYGRKPLLLLSVAGMAISSVAVAIYIDLQQTTPLVIAVVIFVVSFAFGLGSIPFLLSSELVGPDAVASTQSLAMSSSWISEFILSQLFPVVNAALGSGKVYYLFAAIAAAFFLYIVLQLPETKGKSNADEVWGRRPSTSHET